MANKIQYIHHGECVWVDKKLQGKHREHCLCWTCLDFNPDNRETNCKIANVLYANCVAFGIVTPVYECPEYVPEYTEVMD